MTTENLPAVSSGLLPAHQEFLMFQTIAKSAKASGLYGGDENKIFMVLLAARELGIPPMLSLNGGIWNIQGKIEISARLMNSMIRRAGHTMSIKSTAQECVIIGKRADTGEEHTETFTWAMAEKAGLSKGNVWQKYPEDMLYNRCMSRLARRMFPDVIGTAYVEGEIKEAIQHEKDIAEVSYQDVTNCTELVNNAAQSLENGKITEAEYFELLELIKQADDTCVVNMCAWLKNAHSIEDYRNITVKILPTILKGLNNNIEMKKAKVKA